MIICFVVLVSLVIWGVVRFCLCCYQSKKSGGQSISSALLWQRYCIQFCFDTFIFLLMATVMVVVPQSLDLAHEVGQGAVFSGFLISGPFALSTVSLLFARRYFLMSWSQHESRLYVILGIVCFSLSTLVFAFGVDPPKSWGLGREARMVMIIASRIAMGLFSGVGPVLRTMAQKVTPQKNLMVLNLRRVTALSMGIGTGPLLSAVIGNIFGANGIRERAGMPAMVVSVLWAILFALFCFILPTNLGSSVWAKEHEDAMSQGKLKITADTNSTAWQRGQTPTFRSAHFARQETWTVSMLYGLVRALLVSALEASTAMILEVEFKCTTSEIGIAIGACLLLGAPLSVVMSFVRASGRVADTTLLCTIAVVCFLASFLFLIGTNVWLFLVADAFLFPLSYLANGIVDGLAMEYAIPNSFFSQENAIAGAMLLQDNVGLFMGPPLGRYLVQFGGRRVYAEFQICVCTLSLLIAWRIWAAVNVIIEATGQETPLMGKLQVDKPLLAFGTALTAYG